MQALKYNRFSAPVIPLCIRLLAVCLRKVMHDFKTSPAPASHFVASIYPLLHPILLSFRHGAFTPTIGYRMMIKGGCSNGQ